MSAILIFNSVEKMWLLLIGKYIIYPFAEK